MGGLLFYKPGITGSSFAPGASSRPIIRGLDVNRVRIQENGIGANGASDLGEDHFVPVDPLTTNHVEVIRGPATLRFGSQAIGGVVETTNNRIPTYHSAARDQRRISRRRNLGRQRHRRRGAARCRRGQFRGPCRRLRPQGARLPRAALSLSDRADPAMRRTRRSPAAFNGRQPNSAARMTVSRSAARISSTTAFFGLAVTQNDALYHIPGIDGEDHNTRIDAEQTKILTKGEWRAPLDHRRDPLLGRLTDYKHNEIGLADDTDPASDGIRQTFINKEQEARVEAQFAPFNLRFAALTTAVGVQGGHQQLTAPSPDGCRACGTRTPISRIAGYMFNEFKFSDMTKAQIAGRIERVDLSGIGRSFRCRGMMTSTPASRATRRKARALA